MYLQVPIVDAAPTTPDKIAELKRKYAIPNCVNNNFYIVKSQYRYNPTVILNLFARHFGSPEEILPLRPEERLQTLRWPLPDDLK